MDGIEISKKTLIEILSPFREVQRDYLCLRIKGLGMEEAGKLVERKRPSVEFWRANDPVFKETEVYLIDNRKRYLKEAGDYFSSYLFSITFGLLKIANKVNEWDDIKRDERAHIFKACELLSRIQKEIPDGRKKEIPDGRKSYDDRVLEAHKKTKEG